MIAKLTGYLDSIGEDWAIIDVNGVGYMVSCSSRTLSMIGDKGREVSLIIETHMREDQINLYGFFEAAERQWFRLLTRVQGVGARVGLGILSVLDNQELTSAILSQDKAMIARTPGVGPKLATRIVTELKDKVGDIGSINMGVAKDLGPSPTNFSVVDDAVSALVNLGYQKGEVFLAVTNAAQAIGNDTAVENLIRASLKELTNG